MTVSMAMTFQNCYRALLNGFCNFAYTWTKPRPANFVMDSCSNSYNPLVTLWQWNPFTTDQLIYWVGDGTKTSCWPGKLYAPVYEAFLRMAQDYYEKPASENF